MQSQAKTVAAYLAELPPDRRETIAAVRKAILTHLDPAYEEGMSYGMIGYYVPHAVYPPGYHCNPQQPLPYAGLASQKNHCSLYLMSCYGEEEQWGWFREAWAQTGKKLDMGKCCIRFKRVEDLALDVIAEALRRTPVPVYVQHYEAAIRGRTPTPRKALAKQAAAKQKAAHKSAAKKRSPAKKAAARKTSRGA